MRPGSAGRLRRVQSRRPVAVISVLTIVSLLIVALGSPAMPGAANATAMRVSSTSDAAMSKLHPLLRERMQVSPDATIDVHAFARVGTDLSSVMRNTVVRANIGSLGYTTVTGQVRARNLLKLASSAGVEAVMPMEGAYTPATDDYTTEPPTLPGADVQAKMRERIAAGSGVSAATSQATAAPEPRGWYDVLDNHNSAEAWDKGYTGAGVKVMVNDSGVDFAHPDLVGTQARHTDPSSPYYGWPQQYDQVGMVQYASDVQNGTTNFADGNAAGYANTSAVISADSPSYQPLDAVEPYTYTLPETSQSGQYHIGTHPDYGLMVWYALIFGVDLSDPEAHLERPAVLVADESATGVYDTVYVDLNFNNDFTDDKPVRKGDEIVGADWWGAWDAEAQDFAPEPDGYYDESGGMVYWIADGTNPIPAIDWLYDDPEIEGSELGVAGNGALDMGEPESGTLVAFAYNAWASSPAGDHGQLVASNIAGQGRTNADSIDSIFGAGLTQQTAGVVPPYKPDDALGMVTGAGKDVKIVDSGDFYSGSTYDAFILAALGTDGIPGTEDDIQMINNSWGSDSVHNDGWNFDSRVIDYYLRNLNPTLLSLASSGNSGPGFGSVSSPLAPAAISVGASTQYGSTGWDSATNLDQILYGDVAAFSSRGPGSLGVAGVDILASGSRASGALPLNMAFSGPHAWSTWGGTSRSAPVLGGNAALVYQAYRDAYGSWPDSATAKAILMSGADDLEYDPFTMGAGMLNAARAVDIAAGLGGGMVTPSTWEPGDYDGERWPGFAKVMQPGETADQYFEVSNQSETDLRYTVDARWLQKQSQWETEFTSSPISEEYVSVPEDGIPFDTEYDWDTPHYLWNVTDQIPEDTDVVVFRHNFPMEQFDPEGAYDGAQVSDWYVMAFDWTDVNGDGNLWEDLDGNGTVSPDEMDDGEYMRFDYANQRGNNGWLTLREPQKRVHDGLFIALMHNQVRQDVPRTTMTLGMDFYQQVDFPWISFYNEYLDVAAGGSNRVRADIQVPADAPAGIYEASLVFSDGTRTSTVPVTINVAGRDYRMAAGESYGESFYDNGRVYGATNWLGGESNGDTRFYFTDLIENPAGVRRLANGQQFFMVDTAWRSLPGDVNVEIFGPTEDIFSEIEPSYYGPYTLEEIGSSNEAYNGDGAYLVQTSSGGSEEFIAAEYTPGLNQVQLHNVNLGDEPWQAIETNVGVLGVGAAPIKVSRPAINPDFGIPQQVVSTMPLSGLVVGGYGLSKPIVQTGLPIQQDDPNDPTTSSYTQVLEVENAGLLDIQLTGQAPDDLDLFLAYDFNGDGEFDFSSELIAVSGTPTAEESITVRLPQDGLYQVYVHGWAVPEGNSTFDLAINLVQGNDISVTDLPEGGIEPNQTYTFRIEFDAEGLEPGVYSGLVTLGPPQGPGAVLVDVTYEVRE